MGRYDGVGVGVVRMPDGAGGTREVRYLLRRQIASGQRRALAYHPVVDGDRLDLVAATHLGDPLAAWRIADANVVLDPDDLTAAHAEGDLVLIPVPGEL